MVEVSTIEWGFLARPQLRRADWHGRSEFRIWHVADLEHDVQCCRVAVVDGPDVMVVFTHHPRHDDAAASAMEQALSKQFADAVLSFVRDAELASAHVVTSDDRHEIVAAAVAIAMISGTLDDLERVAIVVNDRAFDVAPRFVDGHWSAAID